MQTDTVDVEFIGGPYDGEIDALPAGGLEPYRNLILQDDADAWDDDSGERPAVYVYALRVRDGAYVYVHVDIY
jgi:hypothetical protein